MLGPMVWSFDSSLNIGDKVGQSPDMRGPITELSEQLKHLELVTKVKPRGFHQGLSKKSYWEILSIIVTRKDFVSQPGAARRIWLVLHDLKHNLESVGMK